MTCHLMHKCNVNLPPFVTHSLDEVCVCLAHSFVRNWCFVISNILTFFFIYVQILLQLVWQAREAGAICVLFIVSRTDKKEYVQVSPYILNVYSFSLYGAVFS